ncbi:MAG: hypothetical protein LBV80_03330 [Deltaproteobacteria bacterium]|jgi:hypothetical protein|nr:hypothetical protein [Deltaproteobacteria bacterium]
MVDEKQLQNGVENIVYLIFFEQWLRFYFLTIQDDDSGEFSQSAQFDSAPASRAGRKKLVLRIPEEVCRCLEQELPEFLPLARLLNNRELDQKTSLAAMSYCLINAADAPNSEQWAQILRRPDFRAKLHLMQCWLQTYEEELDATVLSFTAWRDRIFSWQARPEIRDYEAGLRYEMNKNLTDGQLTPQGADDYYYTTRFSGCGRLQ